MVTPARFQRARQLLDTAWSLVGDEQAAFLERECVGDAELRAAVDSLLAADRQMDSFLEQPLLVRPDPPEVRVPAQLGPWRVLGELGRGGMGTVYLGERADGRFAKKVAIKLVRGSLYSPELHRRFLAERQILAALEHPGIARVLDSGETEEGVPYLVMEYVAGEALLDFCDRRDLSVRARVALFREICAAVQYAHQHLVVHRDLKPSNILVTEEGVPKLLDFGVAKLLQAEGSDLTLTVQRALTPQYASPEQVRGEAVTTASDVYSLGVVLYELLTGCRPYRVRGGMPHELARAICEQQPERPSAASITAATTAGGATAGSLASAGAAPDAEAAAAAVRRKRSLRGDLDVIVLQALQKLPERRYPSAAELSEDLRRHLAGMPVMARADSVGYRARKFLGRHRLAVASAALAVLGLAGGLLAALHQGRVARVERDRARLEAATAEQTATFLADIFSIASPARARGATILARQILDEGARRIEVELVDQPEVRARLLDALGHVYVQLGVFGPAAQLFEKELEIQRARHGRYSREAARALYGLGSALNGGGQTHRAGPVLELAVAIQEQRGGDDELLWRSVSALGSHRLLTGDYAGAGILLRRALAIHQRSGPGDASEHAQLLNHLGIVAWQLGELERAVDILNAGLEIAERSDDEVLVTRLVANQVQVLRVQGKLAAAVPLQERALALAEKLYGSESADVARALENQASLYNDLGDFARAQPLYLRSIATYERTAGADHPHLAFALKNYGNLLKSAGDYRGARELYRRALAIREKKLPPENPDVALSLMNLGEIEGLLGNRQAAEPLLRRALQGITAALGPDHPRRADVLSAWAEFLAAEACGAEARAAFAEALRIRRAKLPPGHEKTLAMENQLGGCEGA